jgi:hypothetical protein
MTMEVFTLCDFAQDNQGKLTIIGAFDALTVKDFPAVHPFMCVAARIRFAVYELGSHAIRVDIRTHEGEALMPALEGSMSVNGIGKDSACANLTLNLINVRWAKEGSWNIALSIDGLERAQIPLYVRKAPVQR